MIQTTIIVYVCSATLKYHFSTWHKINISLKQFPKSSLSGFANFINMVFTLVIYTKSVLYKSCVTYSFTVLVNDI